MKASNEEILNGQVHTDSLTTLPMIQYSTDLLSPFKRNLKRLADIISAALALILLSPLFLIVAIIIRRDSKGPVFFSQWRIGRSGKPFRIIKFRSMRTDAEQDGPRLSSTMDRRITKVGRYLRKYRIDELPQFWNVLKGDMSLVGPRPERDYYIRQIMDIAPYYSKLLQVRPGITSWGMVKYGYASTVFQMVERMRYDLMYINNCSIAVDLKILGFTVRTVLTGKGI
jgi:exopolysaccharide biosynthesis polyprenyl glycosylphosphotransferase